VSAFVVPDCDQPGKYHDPPGTRPAVYWYEYRCQSSGLAGGLMVLCAECCARVRMLAEHPDPGVFAPPPTRIGVLRDANTQEPVI
jgi:hypothetical protein